MIPLGALLAPLALLAALAASPALAQPVTPSRLVDADSEPQNWLMNLGNYAGWRYSGLSQIDRANVASLVVKAHRPLGGLVEGSGNWVKATPLSPLVADGFLYIVDGWGSVAKLDLRNDLAIVWESEAGQRNLDAWLEASRGIALYDDFVISASADGTLRWIDAETGEVTRSVTVADPATGYTISAPPLVVEDTLVVAGGGVDRPTPGRIDAIDARTGEQLWTATPPPGGAAAGFVQSGVYDPGSATIYWGAGNPVPLFDTPSAGTEDGFRNTLLALDLRTGDLRWSFGYSPRTANGFSEVGPHQLIPDTTGTRVAHFANNGFFHALDASDGALLLAVPHVPGIEWAKAIDASGTPVDAAPNPPAWGDAPGCPNIRSVAAFAGAFSPRTGLSYGGGADGCQSQVPVAATASTSAWLGAYYSGAANAIGAISAIDPQTGEVVAQRLFDYPLHAGALATAGGLVFTTTAEGSLHALNDETLETIWSQKFATLGSTPPITFAVDGEQFVAVVVGGNALAGELTQRPPEMTMSEGLFVLLVLGLRS